MSKEMKRSTIPHTMITDEVYSRLVDEVINNVPDVYDIKQRDVIEILYPLGISNTTLSTIINDLVPDIHTTPRSVASMIYSMKNSKRKNMLNDLISYLDKDI